MKPVRFPPEIQQHLPSNTLSVREFIVLDLPAFAPATTPQPLRDYTSALPPTVDNVNEIVSRLSPPDDTLLALQQSIRSGQVKSIHCLHYPTANSQRYPLWLVSFWTQLSSARRIQKQWRKAVRNLESQIDQDEGSVPLRQAFNALLYVPWTGQLQGIRDAIDLHQLSVYFTEEWLTNDHELVMLSALKDNLLAAGITDSFIENTAFMLLLGNASRDREAYTTERCYEWLRQRGEDLGIGERRHLSTIANQGGVHWVTIILDFDQQLLLYGDSYGKPISDEHRGIIDWWTKHHANVRFTLWALPTANQSDTFSCGIFTWDGIRVHYGLKATLMNPDRPFECRAEVFLRLTEYYHKDKVSNDVGYN